MKTVLCVAFVLSLVWLFGRYSDPAPGTAVTDSEAASLMGGSCALYSSSDSCNNSGAAGCPPGCNISLNGRTSATASSLRYCMNGPKYCGNYWIVLTACKGGG